MSEPNAPPAAAAPAATIDEIYSVSDSDNDEVSNGAAGGQVPAPVPVPSVVSPQIVQDTQSQDLSSKTAEGSAEEAKQKIDYDRYYLTDDGEGREQLAHDGLGGYDPSDAFDMDEEKKRKIWEREVSVGEVFHTMYVMLQLGYQTRYQLFGVLIKIFFMSLVLLAGSAAEYVFPKLAGMVVKSIVTPLDPDNGFGHREWVHGVMWALAKPLGFSLVITYVNMQLYIIWVSFTNALRRNIGLKLNEMLDAADKKKLRAMVDTPDERIMSDTVGFLLGFFSDEGFLHSMLVVCTTIITGIYVSAYLLGTGTLLFVFAYCAGHISLEVYVVQPIQYITQELVFAKGEVRHLLAMMVEDVPREDTGERVTLEEINGKQHVLYTVQKRFLWIMFWINVVGNLMQHFKDYVFVYFVALMPSLVGGEPPPTIEKLTQTTMSLAMMMGSLLGVTGMFEGW